MADCQSVVDAYVRLSESLSNFADRVADVPQRAVVRNQSDIAGELAEQCDAAFGGRDVPGGDGAVGQASEAADLADEADGDDAAAVHAVLAAARRANQALQAILPAGH